MGGDTDGMIFIGAADGVPQFLDLRMANRHGLVTGATGTGKTVTLQILLEAFSRAGVPSFAADIKGDLSGIAVKGEAKDFLLKRAEAIGLTDYAFADSPTEFWDLYGRAGHPIRTTISEMGPLILARLLELTEVQEGVLNIAFRLADDEGLALLDLKDLRALMVHIADEATALSKQYGRVSTASVGAIQRALLTLEEQGGDRFFGEPAFRIADLMRTAPDGRGVVNVLAADTLMSSPRLYATFLLWLLSELFEELPEVGDPDRPRLVFFFDEAHLLFDDAPKALVDQVERVTRLIRSKGVGIYFVTQNPLDVPDTVLGQLGNRVQHALRAFTPRDQKAVRTAADTFRPNPALDTAKVITELGTGEALTSMLGGKGEPQIVQRTLIRPPTGRLGPLSAGERAVLIGASPLAETYRDTVDRESAYEILAARAASAEGATPAAGATLPEDAAASAAAETGFFARAWDALFGDNGRQPMTTTQRVARSAARTAAAEAGARLGRALAGTTGARLGRESGRGVFGNMLRSR